MNDLVQQFMPVTQPDPDPNQAHFEDCTPTRWAGGRPCALCSKPIKPKTTAHLICPIGGLMNVYHPACCPAHPAPAPVNLGAPAENRPLFDGSVPGIEIEGPRETAGETRARMEAEAKEARRHSDEQQ
jgi:hypothetical protein